MRSRRTRWPVAFSMSLAIISLLVTCSPDRRPSPKTEAGSGLRAPADRPNVIVFFLDDSGYGDFSYRGNPTIETPTIDRLARQGADFRQFYVTSPACSASRYSLLTGRYPARSGFGTWVLGPDHPKHLHVEETTLAEGLQAAGYRTALFGKWHLGSPNANNDHRPESLPLAHGFDEWVGTNVSHDYRDARLIRSRDEGKAPVPGYEILGEQLRTNETVARSLTNRYTEAAVDFINKNHERPFFTYIAHNQPHLGLFCNEEFAGRSRRGLLGDVMAEIDDSVNRVLEALEKHKISNNTLILFMSDNGPWIRFQETESHPAYGEARMHVGYALPFRDGKGSTWEGGLRVPGIFFWPGMIAARSILEPASTLDVLPTLFKLCGVPLPRDRSLDGRDIRPLLDERWGIRSEVPSAEILFSLSKNRASALRSGPWKLHIRTSSQTGNSYGFEASRASPLLFQVEQDFGERFNRAEEEVERRDAMLQRLRILEERIRREGNFWKR